MWNPFRKKPTATESDGPAWEAARHEALTAEFGQPDDVVLHAPVPFFMGPDVGGAADVMVYRWPKGGLTYVTDGLIGLKDQRRNRLGNYELAICTRTEDTHGAGLISRLAYATLESVLNPDETMDIGPAAPESSSVSALLFAEMARFKVCGNKAGVLLCLGITHEELSFRRARGAKRLADALTMAGVYPFTDWFRKSSVR